MSDKKNDSVFDGELKERNEEDLKEPSMYRVILHNDHYTTQEFVVLILQRVFHKKMPDATKIMLDVHKKGKGIVGVYPYDIAATRVAMVRKMAKDAEYPLKCTMEEV